VQEIDSGRGRRAGHPDKGCNETKKKKKKLNIAVKTDLLEAAVSDVVAS
jgi:hypothetical protein